MRQDELEENTGALSHAPLAALLSGRSGPGKSACRRRSARLGKPRQRSPGSANSAICPAHWKPSRTAKPSLGKALLKPPLGPALG